MNTERKSPNDLTGRFPAVSAKLVVPVVGALVVALGWLIFASPSLPDFEEYEDVNEMKQAFRAYLQPIIAEHNAALRAERAELDALAAAFEENGELGFFERRKLKSLAKDYSVDWQDDVAGALTQLQLRVDTVPEALVLAQAAKESGWGRSRFAKEGNNLFGQWCYKKGCGIVPKGRGAAQQHEVADFSSVDEAVGSYMRNLNSHDSYSDLRQLRHSMRASGEPLDPLALAQGLLYYSERREAYVEEVRSMVRQFQRLAREAA